MQTIEILTAGPGASLLFGVVFLCLYRRGIARYTFLRLFLFWLGWTATMEFVNYLIVTPWLGAGDTAMIADALHAPNWARYLVSAAGIALVVALSSRARDTMISMAPAVIPFEDARTMRSYMRETFYLPIIAGTLLIAVAGIGTPPISVFLGMLAALGTSDIIAAGMRRSVKTKIVGRRATSEPIRISLPGFAIYAAAVIAYVFALSHGVPI